MLFGSLKNSSQVKQANQKAESKRTKKLFDN